MGSAPPLHVTVNSKNQVNTTGYTYDLNGNLTALPGIGTPGYDVENRTTSMALTSGDTWTYLYGPDNWNVYTKLTPAGSQASEGLVLYGVSGKKLVSFGITGTTHQLGTAYVYFAGRRIWSTDRQPLSTDRRGTTTDNSHPLIYPYGETSSGGHSFATYEYFSESGLDYAHNRYYSTALARFTTADPYRRSGKLSNPGSWNRYAYVDGDPVNNTDPSGLDVCPPGTWCVDVYGSQDPLDTVMAALSGVSVGYSFMPIGFTGSAFATPVPMSNKYINGAILNVEKILDGKNPCSNFFGPNAIAALNALGPVLFAKPIDSTNVGIRMTVPVTASGSFRTPITAIVNTNGPFLSPRGAVIGGYNPGTPQSETLQLLHELAHLVKNSDGTGWLIPDDGDSKDQSMINTQTILDNCKGQIDKAK